jgi:O-antigen/teichoic acid export membrane protein
MNQPTTPTRSRVPRWMLAVGDQALVALVNLLLSIAVAHVGGVSTLGRFGLVVATVLILLSLTRMMLSDPWLASKAAGEVPSPQLRALTLAAALVAPLGVAVVVVLGCGGDAVWFITCAVAPLIVLQDFGRYAAFRRGAPHQAFLSDGLVLVVGAITYAVWWAVAGITLAAALTSWLVGMTAGLLVVLPAIWGPVTLRGALDWWTCFCRALALRLTHDNVAYLIGANGSLYLLAYLAAPSDVGIVRMVEMIFSPVVLVTTGLSMWLVPHLAQRNAEDVVRLRRRATILLALAAVPMTVGALALGPWFIRLVLGVSQSPDTIALLMGCLSTVAVVVAAPWLASVRVRGNYAPIAWARTVGTVVIVGGLLVVPILRGANGYLAVIAVQNLLVTITAVYIDLRPGPRARRYERATEHSASVHLEA